MAEKIKVTIEMLEKDPPAVKFDTAIPFSVMEDIGIFIATETMILDETGCAYGSWRKPVIELYAYLLYASNLDVSDLDHWEGRKALYDAYAEPFRQFCAENFSMCGIVDDIAFDASHAIRVVHERRNSLEYKLGVLVDLMTVQVKKEESDVGEKLINLLDRVNEADAKEAPPVLTMFAKKPEA